MGRGVLSFKYCLEKLKFEYNQKPQIDLNFQNSQIFDFILWKNHSFIQAFKSFSARKMIPQVFVSDDTSKKINVTDLLTNEVVGTGGLWPVHHYLRKPSLGTEETFAEDIAKMYGLE